MSKTTSGLILIAVGVGMYLAGQVLSSIRWVLVSQSWVLVFAALVVGLFGLFRLIVGLFSPKKEVKAARRGRLASCAEAAGRQWKKPTLPLSRTDGKGPVQTHRPHFCLALPRFV